MNFWDERFAEAEYAYGTAPNRFLESQLSYLPPGHIVFPAEGQGRNAVHAAQKGWQVSAFDTSPVARQRALEWAQQQRVTLDYQLADLANPPFLSGTFDALGLIFAHTPAEVRQQIHQQLAALLKPGGTLILEGFSKHQLGRSSGGPQTESMLFSVSTLEADFGHLDILDLAEVFAELDEGPYHQGEAALLRLVARQR